MKEVFLNELGEMNRIKNFIEFCYRKEIDNQLFTDMYNNISYFIPNDVIELDEKEQTNFNKLELIAELFINDLEKEGV
jgi:hypothetical protein